MVLLLSSATLAALAAFSLQSLVTAQTWTMPGGGAFDNAANWSGAVVPGDSRIGTTVDNDIATLASGGIVDSGRTIRGINMNADAGASRVGGSGPLYLTKSSSQAVVIQTVAGAAAPGSATQTIDLPIVISRVVPASGFTISNPANP